MLSLCCILVGSRQALAEVGRVVKPGGRVLVVDMLPHEREEYQHQMGHVWLGFSEKQLSRLLAGAGFDDIRVRALPADPDAKGPALFVAVATRETADRPSTGVRAPWHVERREPGFPRVKARAL